MNITKQKVISFQKHIFTWWEKNRRDLPWRRTHDPYRIFISEVMLQQTQVSRVLPKYEEFLKTFPDVQALAAASPAAVLKIWKGMGYNRRALYLYRSAKEIVSIYNGVFPDEEKTLRKLPGLGIYTARAILVFAYKRDIAMVDTNIRQIITHFFFDDTPQKDSIIQEAADTLVPKGKSWEWHQALMDYGALELKTLNLKRFNGKKKTIAFKNSNRFFRGKILDRLREGNITKEQLLEEFEEIYGKSKDQLRIIITQLQKDNLVEIQRGILSLPTG